MATSRFGVAYALKGGAYKDAIRDCSKERYLKNSRDVLATHTKRKKPPMPMLVRNRMRTKVKKRPASATSPT